MKTILLFLSLWLGLAGISHQIYAQMPVRHHHTNLQTKSSAVKTPRIKHTTCIGRDRGTKHTPYRRVIKL